MKVSELWLREWVNPTLTGHQLAAQLTMAGLEVDGVHPVAGIFSKVVVAKVVQTSPHPQADKLTLCEVDAGLEENLKIVCGASNVRADLRVALALVGATLPNGMIIKESLLRGQLSQGMLCSASELGLEESSEGIIELASDAPVGVDFRDYLSLDDLVLELDLTPNRADCFSLLGIAREVAVLNQLTYKSPQATVVEPKISERLNVNIQAPKACSHYCGRVIHDINVDSTTPVWMRERLRRSGVRVVHPVVDVMNYVMLELGQPMHAFDLGKISGNLDVRFSHPKENLILLDGQEVTFDEQVLLIADQEKALAIAGVMGGEFSAVQAGTVNIFLESAFFDPLVIAGVARRFGLTSDASMRYERGVDPQLQMRALERATELLIMIVGGHPGPVTEVLTDSLQVPVIAFDPKKVKKLTGVDCCENEMKRMLYGLGMDVTCQPNLWHVHVPSYRFDIQLDVDLVEEIVRLYGYDNIQSIPTIAPLQCRRLNQVESLNTKISTLLCAKGYHETISYSFLDPQLQSSIYPKAHPKRLLNPISSELSEMRVGLWPGLIASMVYNLHRQKNAIKLFESGVVFEQVNDTVKEVVCIAGLITGEMGALNWSDTTRKFDFYDMKGDLESIYFSMFKQSVEFVSDTHDALHPGQTAKMVLDDKTIGWIGVLHPKICEALDLDQDVVLFEIRLSELPIETPPRYQRISKYPQIQRDLSLLVDNTVSALQIENAVRQVISKELLKSVDIFDVYTGESIPLDKKSIAIALTLQDDNRTLTDKEINTSIDATIDILSKDLGIKLRE